VLAMDRQRTQQRESDADADGASGDYGDWASRPPRQGSLGQHPRVAALVSQAAAASMNYYPDVVVAATDEALALARAVGDTLGVAAALTFRAYLHQYRGEPEAVTLGEESLALYRSLHDKHGTWRMLQSLGGALLNLGEYPRARAYYEEALALARSEGDVRGNAQELRFLGQLAFLEGDFERATQLYAESATWWAKMPARRGYQWLLRDQGRLLLAQGDLEAAAARLRESVRVAMPGGEIRTVIACFEALAGALATASPVRAARLLGAAAALRATRGLPIAGVDHPYYKQAMAATRAALDEQAFETAFAEGQSMTLDEAVACALDEAVADALDDAVADALDDASTA